MLREGLKEKQRKLPHNFPEGLALRFHGAVSSESRLPVYGFFSASYTQDTALPLIFCRGSL